MRINFGRRVWLAFLGLLSASLWANGDIPCGEAAATEKTALTFSGTERITNQQLRDGVVSYYIAEANKDWAETYKFRRSKFHDVVPFAVYERTMGEETQGWDLVAVEILESRAGTVHLSETSSLAVTFVRIRYTETLGKGYDWVQGFEGTESPKDRTFVSTEESAWFIENKKIKCLSCGTRGHIPLNIPMRYD